MHGGACSKRQSSSEFLSLIISGNKKSLNILFVHANDHPDSDHENLGSVFHITIFFNFSHAPAGKKYLEKVFKVIQNKVLVCQIKLFESESLDFQ